MREKSYESMRLKIILDAAIDYMIEHEQAARRELGLCKYHGARLHNNTAQSLIPFYENAVQAGQLFGLITPEDAVRLTRAIDNMARETFLLSAENRARSCADTLYQMRANKLYERMAGNE